MEYGNHYVSLILQLIENYISIFVFALPAPNHKTVNPQPWAEHEVIRHFITAWKKQHSNLWITLVAHSETLRYI